MAAHWFAICSSRGTPATQPVVNSTATFAYRTAPEFLAMEAGDRGTGNVNYSPASMWMALAIAAQGANGTTRSQLNELLGSGSLTDSDYQSLLSSINGQYSGAKSEMSAANSLWIDDDYSLASDYQSTVKKMFEPKSPRYRSTIRPPQRCPIGSPSIRMVRSSRRSRCVTVKSCPSSTPSMRMAVGRIRSKSSPPATAPSTAKPEMLRCR